MKMKEYSLFKTICLMVAVVPFVYVSGNGNETALRAALQTGYDQFSRPEFPTNVSFLFMLRTLQHLDITSQTMKTTTLLKMDWVDSRLVWDTSAYGNITSITINWGWRPQFFIGNSADEVNTFGTENEETTLLIFHNGNVVWNVYFTAETTCEVKIVNFPFDEQTCEVELGFLYHDYGINILPIITLDKVDQTFIKENGEWSLKDSLMDTTQFYQCCPVSTPFTVNAHMTFTRRQPYYIINIIMPIILLSFCVPWAFYITTESGERLGYALTMLLSYFVFLTVTSEMMPSTSLEIPILAQYLLVVLLICMIVLITVAIQVKLYFLETNPGLLARKLYYLVQMVMSFKCCKEKHKTPIRPLTAASEHKLAIPKEDVRCSVSGCVIDFEEEVTWKCIVVTLDRFFFYSYNIIVILCNFSLIVALYT